MSEFLLKTTNSEREIVRKVYIFVVSLEERQNLF